jgi:uncharacterized protein YbgA (DUF1722 family)/uncharacterized protein YbbK (DUF523 family)
MEIGLGAPRDTIRLEKKGNETRLIQPNTGIDLTDKMSRYSHRKASQFSKHQVFGFILKAKSPSCGLYNMKVYKDGKNQMAGLDQGRFAKVLQENFPYLPMEEEGRLSDSKIRENWVARVFAYYRFHTEIFPRPTMSKLVKFHSQNKFHILSYCENSYRKLGKIVGNQEGLKPSEIAAKYEKLFMEALSKKTSKAKNVNVMDHMLGFFKTQLSSEARKDLRTIIADYRKDLVPLIVPISLIKHYASILEVEYISNQTYLNPHPKEMALRFGL